MIELVSFRRQVFRLGLNTVGYGEDHHRFRQAGAHRDAHRYQRYLPLGYSVPDPVVWPGLPCPGWPEAAYQPLEPTKGDHVRLRRIELLADEDPTGIVIGRVGRWEGEVCGPSGYDDSQSYLAGARRVELVEVVVPHETKRAELFLVHPDDIGAAQ